MTVSASASLPFAFFIAYPLAVLALAAILAHALALALALAGHIPLALAFALAEFGGGFIAPVPTRASYSFRPLADFPVDGLVKAKMAILSIAHDSVDPLQLLVMSNKNA